MDCDVGWLEDECDADLSGCGLKLVILGVFASCILVL